ncbi:hypothetical protein POTOM_053263 [Populus tomentosa]|uniref:Disease resistance RPP13-like protein 1 n=1 Tax=Populus tomentosa TaxID=118781 RepID=A0A8X7Y3V9_POPTO|nr:hypothetical protein POTOM_053263 [Populus tomentosa]
MALELIGGSILSPVIQVLVDRLASREVLSFFNSHKLGGGLLEKLNETLNTVNGLLDDAEEKQIAKLAVKNWLNDVKHAVYEAEDILEEIDYEYLRSKDIDRPDSNWVRDRFPFLNPANKRMKEMEAELQRILEKLERLLKQKGDLRHIEGTGGWRPLSKKTTPLVNESLVYGRDADKEAIMEHLLTQHNTDGSNLCAVPIVGMGGIGKTTLAQLIYNDERVEQCFDLKAWVWASQQFDVARITEDIIKKIKARTCPTKEPDESLMEAVKGKNLLLVLDDAWNIEYNEWDKLLLPLRYVEQGSKIVVTTRDEDVARVTQTVIPFHRLNVISDEYCWNMHDIISDLAEYASGEFCSRLEGGHSCSLPERTRYLSITSAAAYGEGLRIFRSIHGVQHWRTLYPLYTSRKVDIEALNDILPNLKRLRMLSLCFLQNISSQLNNISIDNLIHLRHLDLSGTAIEMLPGSVCTLYYLQSLLLRECRHLMELPSNISNLVNLQHLDINSTNLEEMPPKMGKLTKLQTLQYYVVGKESGSSMKELGKLSHLRRKLSIRNLRDVANAQDALDADLKGKKKIEELGLTWDGNTEDTQHEREVLEKLQPSENVEQLVITGYGGTMFPGWFGNSSFSNMVALTLSGCKNCIFLPPLGLLRSLEVLQIKGFDEVVAVGSEFYGSDALMEKPFKSLKILKFEGMKKWQEWNTEVAGAFPHLEKLLIAGCPELTNALPSHLPCLWSLFIEECPQLVVSIPEAPLLSERSLPALRHLTVRHCPNLVSFPRGGLAAPDLKSLVLEGCLYLKSLPENMHSLLPSLQNLQLISLPEVDSFPEGALPSLSCFRFTGNDVESFDEETLPSTLTTLEIKNLKSLDYKKLHHLTSLDTLKIKSCPKLEHISEQALPSSLECLHLCKLESLDCIELQHLTSLHKLKIGSFPKLESLQGLPSSLEFLQLWDQQDRDYKEIRHLTSLRKMKIRRSLKLESLQEGTLPSSLEDLEIWDLEDLEFKGFQHLTSLRELHIRSSPKLESVPGEKLPSSLVSLALSDLINAESVTGLQHLTSLRKLIISDCPKLQGEWLFLSGWRDIRGCPSLEVVTGGHTMPLF